MAVSVGELLAYLRLDSAGFDAAIRAAQTEMTGAAGSAAEMEAATTGAGGALAGAGRMANVAASGSAKLRAAQLSAVAATERYNAVLADEDASLARLASAEAAVIRANERVTASTPIAAIRTANTEAAASAGVMGRAGGAFGGFAKSAAGLGIALGGFALALKAVDIVKQGAQFQRSMLLVQTQAGASAAEVKSFSAAVLGMAGQVATAPDKLANSLYHAYSVGLRGAQALDAVKVAAEGAKVGNADLEQTTNALTAAVASGIPGVQNMSQAMGALNTIVGAGDMNLEQLNEALGSGILVVAKQFGVTLTDVGAALATFGDNNIRGAQAATTLRVSINAMAKPVAGGADELKKMGLSANALAKDMQEGGLNQALHDLKDHLTAAGVTGNKVGDVLLTAFGKKAGPGVSVLVDQLSRFDQKTSEIEKGAGSFGDRWKATTQTASFAFQRLGAEIESGGIVLTEKLMPALSKAAMWLGTSVPHAISVLARALGPTVSMIGDGLVGAWRALGAVLEPVMSALGSVGHFLASQSGLVKDVATGVLVMWAAWKGVAIATAAITAVNAGLSALITRAQIAGDRMAMIGRGTATVGMQGFATAAAAAGFAVYELGTHISDAIEGDRVSRNLGDMTAAVNGWRDALVESNGALTENIQLGIEKKLQDSGLASRAAAAGISLRDLTAGVTGNTKAQADLIRTWITSGKVSGDTIFALSILQNTYRGAAANADDLRFANNKTAQSIISVFKAIADGTNPTVKAANATADAVSLAGSKAGLLLSMARHWGSVAAAAARVAAPTHAAAQATKAVAQATHLALDTSGNFAHTTTDVAKAADAATKALDAQTTASKQLKLAEDLLNGVSESLELATDSFTVSVKNLEHGQNLATDANGKATASLSKNTAAGATNRQMLVGLIDQAKAQAQAVADQTAKHKSFSEALAAGNKALKSNEDKIRSAAAAAHMDKGAVDDLIGSLGIISKIKAEPKVTVDPKPAQTAVQTIQARIDAIRQGRVPGLTANSNAGRAVIAELQQEIDNLHDKTIYVNVQQRVLGAPIPHASGGYGGPLAAARTAYGMVNGPGTGTSDTAGIYKLSAREFVSTAASVARNAGALEAGNRGATLVAIDGLARTMSRTRLPTVAASSPHPVSVTMPSRQAAPIHVTIELDGEVVARRIVRPEIDGALDQLGRTLTYGRRT